MRRLFLWLTGGDKRVNNRQSHEQEVGEKGNRSRGFGGKETNP